jgi:hypothetical protein
MDFLLKLPYNGLPPNATEVQTTIALIRYAVTQKYPEGLPRTELRLWARLEAAMEADGVDRVELTREQFTFIFECALAAKWQVGWTKVVVPFLEHLEACEKRM